jgi:hypothetical protein
MLHLILHPKQREIIENPARFKVIRAGRKAGKTTLEVEEMSFIAVSGKDRNIFYIAPTQTQARDIIWEVFKKRLSGIANFNEQRLEIKTPTKEGGFSLIKLAGWENRENFRGKSAHKLVFDEVDTMRDFFVGWQEIFRPTLLDTGGDATFIGTPKKENPNLRRLEKLAELDNSFAVFHFTSLDNPYLSSEELESVKSEYKDNYESYQQEILADYVDNTSALFRYSSLVDMFSNTITKSAEKYLIVDIADDGSDKTIFNFWQGLESYRIEQFERLNTEGIINQIREYASQERIPYSQIAVDAIGVGAGVASSSLLDGIVGFKSSYQAFKTDQSIVHLPNVHYLAHAPLATEYKNLRSQCVFTLADLINNHKIACKVQDVKIKERIIEELALYQDASQGDGKRMATMKENIKEILGRSPDLSDTLIMRMYFEVRSRLLPQSEDMAMLKRKQDEQFLRNLSRQSLNSSK